MPVEKIFFLEGKKCMRNVLLKSSMLLQAFEFILSGCPVPLAHHVRIVLLLQDFLLQQKSFMLKSFRYGLLRNFFQCRLEYFDGKF